MRKINDEPAKKLGFFFAPFDSISIVGEARSLWQSSGVNCSNHLLASWSVAVGLLVGCQKREVAVVGAKDGASVVASVATNAGAAVAGDLSQAAGSSNVVTVVMNDDAAGTNEVKRVVKSEEEWRRSLTPEQYRVLREAGTERAFGAAYEEFKKQGGGTYVCAGCGAVLFSSKEKFDSHCGWPSFYDPANARNVKVRVDRAFGMERTEVLCAVCDGHLGHVFKGEGFKTPTDQRYCINAVSLKFVPAGAEGEGGKK